MFDRSLAPGYRRNFRLGVLNGLFFTLADTLMDPTLVLVVLVSHLTPSPLWLGLLVPLRDGAWFLPQLWVSGFLQSQPRKLPLYRQMALVRLVAWAVLTLAVFFVRSPALLLATFFGAFTLYAVAAGFSGLPFLEIVGKTVAPDKRALYFAWRLTLGGVAALGASGLVRWLLDEAGPFPFPHNFGVLFGLVWVAMLAGLASFGSITEPPDPAVRAPVTPWIQLGRARAAIRVDGNFRAFLALRALLLVAGAATPFFAVYVQQRLGGTLAMVGAYLATFTAASLLANALFGRFSARLGNRRTMAVAAAASLGMAALVLGLMALAAPLRLSGAAASLWLLPVFALSGVREAGAGVAGQSLLLDIAPPGERTLYLGFSNSFLGIVLLATGLSGVVVQALGLPVLVASAFAASGGALFAALRMRDCHGKQPPL